MFLNLEPKLATVSAKGVPMREQRERLGKRIREGRKRLGLTQRELADRAGLPAHQIVSQIEKGEREVKAWELARIAQVLCQSVNELLASETPPTPVVLWRDDPGKEALTLEARFLQRCREYHLLERLLELASPDHLPEFRADPARLSLREADQLAENTRDILGLGARPAVSLAKVLERNYGVKIWYEFLGPAGSAVSVVGEFGYGVLVNAGHAPWRRNYSLAHELFHIVTWHSAPVELRESQPERWSQVERAAQVFASTLLLPGETTCAHFDARVTAGKVKYADLVELARDFDVSTEALLWRLVHLERLADAEAQRVLSDPAFRALDRETMPERWWEPLVPPEHFVRLAFLAHQKGKISRSRLARLLGTSLLDLEEKLATYGLSETQDYQAAATVA
jgi:Zn-dependent peptidase ImmA (M78 family)/transcriptional regulator with XRE-family HTH domain